MIIKFFLINLCLSIFISCSISQHYSTKNKKAIKLFEKGKIAPSQSIDINSNMPNYQKGIYLMEKAIDKDPNFWEAHMFAAEMNELIYNYKDAIYHYQKGLEINPQLNSTGSTYFYLSNLQKLTGDYQNAIKNIELFNTFKNANPILIQEGKKIKENCLFAINAINNPVDFNPINIGPGINTESAEYFPTITLDGKTLLFTRRVQDSRLTNQIKKQEDFYISHLNENNIWQKSIPMPLNINTIKNEGAPSISGDGRSLVFVACPDISGKYYGANRTGKGSCDLFFSKKIGNKWSDPINLPGSVNTPSWETQPSLSSDGKTMYFIRRIGKDKKNSDIFVSHLNENEEWSKPEHLPNYINTPEKEESVLIHPDGKTLYFASRGHVGMGGSDLFVCRLDDDNKWSKPENLGYPINTKFDENSILVSADGNIAFFASNREGGYGDLDIYYFKTPQNSKPTKTLYFKGFVYDINTNKPITGKFELIDLKTEKVVFSSEADSLTGQFIISLPVNHEYALSVSYDGYALFSQNFNMNQSLNLQSIHMNIPLTPIKSSDSKPIVLTNVFFDINESTLRKESYIELDKLILFLDKNRSIKIQINGHTDSRGDKNKNIILSQNRAIAVKDYLVMNGIDQNRLIAKGFGSLKPVYNDDEIEKMKFENREKAHQANRRTEYKIIK